ncbi:MAG: M13 family metallopeptidase [Elusimicrobia bacterium]|nr:M13 family metallopeptidase [Elusimicrobiota bacterium]
MPRLLPLALILLSAAAQAQSRQELLDKPLPPVYDPAAVDKSADPCADFYRYSCGSWLKANPVPADQAVWWRFSLLDEHTLAVLGDILEKTAADSAPKDAARRKIGDYYASCMDEAGVEAKGLAPYAAEFDAVAALKSPKDLPALAARLHKLGAPALFAFTSAQDYTDASTMIAFADQGGFALPDRDYYLTDAFKTERAAYAEHLRRMFKLAGDAEKRAAEEADAVLRVETALAAAAMGRVERREPANVHHKMKLTDFEARTPSFDWKTYLAGVNAPAFASLDVSDPGFFAGLEKSLQTVPLGDWRSYLRWTILHGMAGVGPKAVVDEDFAFFGKTLGGQQENKARWKRCVAFTDAQLGEALGQAYVEREFSPEAKARVLSMVAQIEKAMEEDIKGLPWMSKKTKAKALEKLAGVANKIGYPDKWRDYSALKIARGDAFGNMARASAFELDRQLKKVGKPVDRGEWSMTPPTDNAYYDPQMNDINFPAGILQPPNFDMKATDAANYGDLVAVVGHELTHGFDDEGRHYDAKGNLQDWWTADDAKAFEGRASGLVGEYGAFVAAKDPTDPSKDVHLDGKLTLGENTADNGGILLAHDAFMATPAAKGPKNAEGFTPEQEFFVAYGQAWCVNRTDEYAKKMAKTNPHSPGEFRVNGVVSNQAAFRRAFACKEGTPMAPNDAHRVW